MKRFLLTLLSLALVALAGAGAYLYYRWHDEQVFVRTPFGQGTVSLEVPQGGGMV